MDNDSDSKREFLRHITATLAYRCGKVITGTIPDNFRDFRISEQTRTPGEILAHINDLLDWALRLAKGESGGLNSKPLQWKKETERFFSTIREFDLYLAGNEPLKKPAEKLLQGPIADALTHTGQIAMMRRLAGSPVLGENYFKAEILIGRVGNDQSDNRYEFV